MVDLYIDSRFKVDCQKIYKSQKKGLKPLSNMKDVLLAGVIGTVAGVTLGLAGGVGIATGWIVGEYLNRKNEISDSEVSTIKELLDKEECEEKYLDEFFLMYELWDANEIGEKSPKNFMLYIKNNIMIKQ